jgi:hypothetical protein
MSCHPGVQANRYLVRHYVRGQRDYRKVLESPAKGAKRVRRL